MPVIRAFSIHHKPGDGYWLTGAPRNWKPGDAWLVAHDVFHHFNDDDGSVAREVMSFGVEAWLEAPSQGIANSVSPGTLAGTLQEVFDKGYTAKRLASLVIEEAPQARFPDIPPDVREFFRLLAKDAIAEIKAALQVYYEVPEKDGALLQRVSSSENASRYAHWLMCGYQQAKQLYPDARAFRKAFVKLQDCVKKMPSGKMACFSLRADARLVAENRCAAKCLADIDDTFDEL